MDKTYRICEKCGQKPALSLSYFGDRGAGKPNGKWMLCCGCTSDTEDYYIILERISQSAGEVFRWIKHLKEKPWMDWADFTDAIARV